MSMLRKYAVFIILAALLFAACAPGPAASAEESSPWATAAEAEAARVQAEETAMACGQIYNELNDAALEAEEAAEEAAADAEEKAAALETARAAAEKADAGAKAAAETKAAEAEAAWQAAKSLAEEKAAEAEAARGKADEAYQQLAEAAMTLKEATEASVRLSQSEAVDSEKISGSFSLGETYQGKFNEELEPVYLRFLMDRDAKVRIVTTKSNVGISVLNEVGSTILTLVPSSTGKGSLCTLSEGEYTLLVSAIGVDQNICITVTERSDAEPTESLPEDETEMETLIEFDD